MKPIEGYDKLRGGYYTPSDIADFIVRWVGPTPENTILEPVFTKRQSDGIKTMLTRPAVCKYGFI